jgi:hypothetical protein
MSADPHHLECWELLPWLANGRLAGGARVAAEEHLRICAACRQELEVQRRLCATLSAPERVTYAPGPSFRKLLERIDGVPGRAESAPVARPRTVRRAGAWRAAPLAWAASVVAVLGATLWVTAERWSQPVYLTHTENQVRGAGVLHIAFAAHVSVDDASALLRAAGARVVEGPDTSGVFGVAPTTDPREASLRMLASRLRADPRVRWVEPLPEAEGTPASHAPGS